MSETKIDISRASKAIRDSRFVEALSMLESNLAKDQIILRVYILQQYVQDILKIIKTHKNI